MCVCVCVCGRSSVVVRSSPKQLCGVYGGQFDLSSLPSNTWQIACVLYGGGCVLLGFSSLAAVFCLLLPSHWAKRLASYTGYIQTMAGNIILCIIILSMKHCLMRLWNDINQLTFVFPAFAETIDQLSECDVSWPREFTDSWELNGFYRASAYCCWRAILI